MKFRSKWRIKKYDWHYWYYTGAICIDSSYYIWGDKMISAGLIQRFMTFLTSLDFPPWFDTITDRMTNGLQTLNYFFPIHTMLVVVTWCFGITVVAIVTKFILSVLKII